jgi:beta-lactamase regulating signal transducer with metallopeptidase domain
LTPPQAEAVVTVTETRSRTWPFLFTAIWAAFGACRVTRVIRGYYRLRSMKCRGTLWNCLLPGLARPVRVLISPEVSSPVAAGFLHPAIMLPEDLREQLAEAEMDFILLHESAHLARYDDWENLIAQMVGAVAGLHPVAWWILRRIKREREMACDEWVVAHTGAALPYADCLMRLLERKLAPSIRFSPQGSLRDVPSYARGSRCCCAGDIGLRRPPREFPWG